MRDKILAILRLIRANKPTGFLLLLLPALITLSFMGRLFSAEAAIVTAGAFITRSLGCVINDICDKDIDRHVTRTKSRPLTNGDLNLTEAYFTALLLAVASLYIATFVPTECYIWILFTAFMICIYPLSKRFFALPQIILGLTFGQCVFLTAFLAQIPIDINIFSIYCSICFWVISFDTIYALSDYEDDKKINIFTSVKTLGIENSKTFAVALHGFSQAIMSLVALSYYSSAYHFLVLAISWTIYYRIYKLTFALKDLSQSLNIFNWHVYCGISWIFLLMPL